MPTGSDKNPAILLVDDVPANLVTLRAVLSSLNEPLVEASSGTEALRILLRRDFACVLLDVEMPGLDGFEIANLLKKTERTKHIPILFLTAAERNEAHVVRGYAEGAVDFIVKPFNPDIVRAKVKVFVDLHRRAEAMRQREAVLREREREIERRQALERERAVQRAGEERLRLALDAASLGTWELDPKTMTFRCDARAKTLLGLGSRAVVDHVTFQRCIHPEDLARVEADMKAALTPGEFGLSDLEYRVVGEGGEWVRWRRSTGRAYFEGGEPVRLIGTLQDITDRKLAEAERAKLLAREVEARADAERHIMRLQQVETELQEAVCARDEFLSVASHELRTPLTPLLLKLQTMRRALDASYDAMPVPSSLAKSFATCETQVRRMSALVTDLLDVTRLSQGRLTLKLEAVDMREVIDEVANTLAPQAAKSNSTIEVETDGPVEGLWDRLRLNQLITNLVSNALKYGAGKPVRVRLDSDSTEAILEVSDQGIGIPAQHIPRLFGKFQRAVSERNYGGLGLGLYISRQIVEAMGGCIGVESEPGHGATFTVRLPVHAAEARSAICAPAAEAANGLNF